MRPPAFPKFNHLKFSFSLFFQVTSTADTNHAFTSGSMRVKEAFAEARAIATNAVERLVQLYLYVFTNFLLDV